MALAITTLSQTPTAEDVSGSVTFQSLDIVNGQFSYLLNGGAAFRFTATLKTDGDELFASFTVASGGLTVTKRLVELHRGRISVTSSPAGSRFEKVPGVGHFLQLEDPDRVNRLIADWIG
jgi:pimeloyl-ACP methyl ester carboxylesterase